MAGPRPHGLTPGRMAHYVAGNSGPHLAAIIIKVVDAAEATVNLHVLAEDRKREQSFGGKASKIYEHVPFSEGAEAGTWHRPGRID